MNKQELEARGYEVVDSVTLDGAEYILMKKLFDRFYQCHLLRRQKDGEWLEYCGYRWGSQNDKTQITSLAVRVLASVDKSGPSMNFYPCYSCDQSKTVEVGWNHGDINKGPWNYTRVAVPLAYTRDWAEKIFRSQGMPF